MVFPLLEGDIIYPNSPPAKPPIDPIDIIALAGDDSENYVYDLFDVDFYDKRLASDTVVTFIKEQRLKIAILESVDDIEHGKLHTVLERVKSVLDIDVNVLSPGIDTLLLHKFINHADES